LLFSALFNNQIPEPEPEPVHRIVEVNNTIQEKEEYEYTDGEHGGQCVIFVQRHYDSYYDHPAFRGTAGNIVPNTSVPEVGSAVITNEGPLGHVALIKEIEGDNLILIESNFYGDERITSGRVLPVDSYKIKGYYNFN